MSTTRGTIPDYTVKGLRVNKLRIFTGEVEKQYRIDGVATKINPSWLLPENAPDPFGLPCTGASSTVSHGMCIINFTYEGNTAGQDTFKSSDWVVEMDNTMKDEPIQVHPSFRKNAKEWGWDFDKKEFKEYANAVEVQGPRLTKVDAALAQGVRNEFYGMESWLVPGATLRTSFSGGSIPSWVMQGIGEITKSPQGLSKLGVIIPPKRNWLKLGPKIQSKGNTYQITAEWMLSGPRGWNKDIYGQSFL
jgi:hypothetical protein